MIYAMFLCTILSNGRDYCIPSEMWFGPYQTLEDCQQMAAVVMQGMKIKGVHNQSERCFSKPAWTPAN